VVRGHVYLQTSERDLFLLQPSVIHHSPDDTADVDPVLPNPTGDDETTETIPPPDANNKHKASTQKLKVFHRILVYLFVR